MVIVHPNGFPPEIAHAEQNQMFSITSYPSPICGRGRDEYPLEHCSSPPRRRTPTPDVRRLVYRSRLPSHDGSAVSRPVEIRELELDETLRLKPVQAHQETSRPVLVAPLFSPPNVWGVVVPLWYRLLRPMHPDRPRMWTHRTIRTLPDTSTPVACRLGAERSPVQIRPPRLITCESAHEPALGQLVARPVTDRSGDQLAPAGTRRGRRALTRQPSCAVGPAASVPPQAETRSRSPRKP
jgi:hypothetical protein